jgi:lysozyme family protein
LTKKFEKGWEYVKKNEGGYIDDEDDGGGVTKFGISLRFLKGLDIKEGDINDDNKISEEDIKGLDEEKAKELYYVHFWLPPKCEEIDDSRVAIYAYYDGY